MRWLLFFLAWVHFLARVQGQTWDDYTDSANKSIYYFWPDQMQPFDNINIYFTAPECVRGKCEIAIIPCNINCTVGVNCSKYNAGNCTSNTNTALDIDFPLTLRTANVIVRSAEPAVAARINVPGSSLYYPSATDSGCTAFNVMADNVSFVNINFTIGMGCSGSTIPLIYQSGGTVNLQNIAWNSNQSLALFAGTSSQPLAMKVTASNLTNSKTTYDLMMLNVKGALVSTHRTLLVGDLIASAAVMNLSRYIAIADTTIFGCRPSISYSNSKCSQIQTTSLCIYIFLGFLIGFIVYLSLQKCISHLNYPGVKEKIPAQQESEKHGCKPNGQ